MTVNFSALYNSYVSVIKAPTDFVFSFRSPPRVPQQHIANGSNHQKELLGPPMNSLNRSRSRSPSHFSPIDSRRSVSPNFSRKTLAPPSNRSRSPTPNYTSTHLTKLRSSKQGPQSLPYIPTTNTNTSPVNNGKHTKQENGKMLKTEASLNVSDALTDHSDNASEVSDEGYRSLGIVHNDKTKNRTSIYSQNSVEDVDENGELFLFHECR